MEVVDKYSQLKQASLYELVEGLLAKTYIDPISDARFQLKKDDGVNACLNAAVYDRFPNAQPRDIFEELNSRIPFSSQDDLDSLKGSIQARVRSAIVMGTLTFVGPFLELFKLIGKREAVLEVSRVIQENTVGFQTDVKKTGA